MLQNVLFYPTAMVRRTIEMEHQLADLRSNRAARCAMSCDNVKCTIIGDDPLFYFDDDHLFMDDGEFYFDQEDYDD